MAAVWRPMSGHTPAKVLPMLMEGSAHDDAKKFLATFDQVWAGQPKGSADAKLIVLANYGDLAIDALRRVLEAAPTLVAQRDELVRALEDMCAAWLDYHYRHSLIEPVTGRAGNAYDRARRALEKARTR